MNARPTARPDVWTDAALATVILLWSVNFVALKATLHEIAPLALNIPVYSQATAAERETYMFMSFNATGGLNSDGTPGSTIF